MRKYENQQSVIAVTCNRCGKEMKMKDGTVREGCIPGNIVFGYFSEKDGEKHRFDLCEACYDEIISTFKIPVEITENHELL